MKVKKKIAPLYPISSTPVPAQVKPLLSDQEKRFLELLAREAYELGWKQAKSKKDRKKGWFNGNINSDYV